MMKEARDRNSEIIIECLPWACPGWMSGVFSQDSADYFFYRKPIIHGSLISIGWQEPKMNVGVERTLGG